MPSAVVSYEEAQLQTTLNIVMVRRTALLHEMDLRFFRVANRSAIVKQTPVADLISVLTALGPRRRRELVKKKSFRSDMDSAHTIGSFSLDSKEDRRLSR